MQSEREGGREREMGGGEGDILRSCDRGRAGGLGWGGGVGVPNVDAAREAVAFHPASTVHRVT